MADSVISKLPANGLPAPREPASSAAGGVRKLPGIQRLSAVSVAVFALLTVLIGAALGWSSLSNQAAMESVSRDTRSEAVAAELGVSVLMFQRLSNLYLVAPEPGIAAEQASLKASMQQLLELARGLVGQEGEGELLDIVAVQLDAYLLDRARLEISGRDLDDVVRESRPALETLLGTLERLGDLNHQQVQRARARADAVDRLSQVLGISAGALVVLGLTLFGLGVRRYLTRPLLALHQSMARFRGGDLDARCPVAGARELADLAEMFNDLAGSVAQQREAQLTFLAGVAHDLNNPLSGLKVGLYTLEYEQSEARRSATRARLDHEVDRLGRMIGDLLDATRIEAGHLEIRCVPFDLRRLVTDMVRLYAPTAPDHHIDVDLPSTRVTLCADPLRMEQVVSNLLSNAIKYSPGGGSIRVQVRQAGEVVTLSVTDQGIGIPADELADVFLPFRRRRFNVAPGAGLGLSVVRRILAAHGGTIDVSSEPGMGSTFTVRLAASRSGAVQA